MSDFDSQKTTAWQDLDYLEMAVAGLNADANTFLGRRELTEQIDRIYAAAETLTALIQKLSRAKVA